MIVLGGGPIGCEMAQAFARLGTRVTLVEALDRLLPREEPAASAVIADALTRDGVDVRVGATRRAGGAARRRSSWCTIEDGTSLAAEELLVAIGRTPSGGGFGLEEIGVEVDTRGAVVVDATMATRWRASGPPVTSPAACSSRMPQVGWVGSPPRTRCRRWPRSDRSVSTRRTCRGRRSPAPEVGRVGLTEAEAAVAHPRGRVAYLPLERVDRGRRGGVRAWLRQADRRPQTSRRPPGRGSPGRRHDRRPDRW